MGDDNPIYSDYLLASPNYRASSDDTISSYDITMIAHMSLSLVPNNLSDSQLEVIQNAIIDSADSEVRSIINTAFGVPIWDRYFYWGSNGVVLNDLMIIGAAYDITGDDLYRTDVQHGIDYIFGRNALGQSYVTGYGEQATRNPTHTWYANSINSDFPTIPPGFLTGGSNSAPGDETAIETLAGCVGMTCYIDHIESYSTNEIAININSTLVWVTSFLLADTPMQPPPATPTPVVTPAPTPTAVVTPPSSSTTAQSIAAVTAPSIDGNVDAQWSAAQQYRMQTFIGDGNTASTNDLSGTFRPMNDNNNLYILVEVTDDVQQSDSGNEWWQDDAIEIYIDGDNSLGTTYDGINDYQLGFRWNDSDVMVGVNSISTPTGIQQRMVNTNNGYRLEVAIPLAQVGIVLGTDTRFGLDVQVIDDDDGGQRETKLAWYTNTDETWFNPSLFGTGQLQRVTTVEPPSSTAQSSRSSSPPQIDGTIDAQWASARQYAMQNVIVGNAVSVSDLSGTFRLLNDETHLYILVEVTDDAQQNDSGDDWWQDDTIEIYIDGDNSQRSTYDGVNDYQLGFRWNDLNVMGGTNSARVPVGIQQSMVNTTNGYRLEVAIPLAQVGIASSTGTRFGLDVQVIDDDNGGQRETKLAWYASMDDTWADPSLFGVGELGALGQGIESRLDKRIYLALIQN